jgi:mRNA interferase MazF
VVVRRFEVYLVNLDPTLGTEIQKTRPCVIISPDEMNDHIEGKEGQVVLDQIRTVDKIRLVKKLGKISPAAQKEVLAVLLEMFSE